VPCRFLLDKQLVPLHSFHAHVSTTCCTVRGAMPLPVGQAAPYIHYTLTFPSRAAQSVVPCRFLLDKQLVSHDSEYPLTFITRSRFHHVLHSPWCRAASCLTSSWSATTLNTPLHSLHSHVSITCCTVRGAVLLPVRQAAPYIHYTLTFLSRAAQSVVPCRIQSDKQLVSHDSEYPLTFITRSRFHHVLHSPWCRAASSQTSSWSATTLNTP